MSDVCDNVLLEVDGVAYCYWIPKDVTHWGTSYKSGHFDEAFSWCAAKDGHLAIIDSQKKIDHLNKTISWPKEYGSFKK